MFIICVFIIIVLFIIIVIGFIAMNINELITPCCSVSLLVIFPFVFCLMHNNITLEWLLMPVDNFMLKICVCLNRH